MFRRLVVTFGLLQLCLLAALALAAVLVLSQPGEQRAVVWLAALAAVPALMAVTVLSALVVRHYVGPLRELIEVADQVAEGEVGRHVFAPGHDEVGQLGRAFNRMNDRLDQRIGRLEEDRQQLLAVLGGMVEGVVALDAEQRVLFANERAAQLLEFPSRNPVGRRLWEVVRQRPLLDVVRRALEGTGPRHEEVGWSGAASRSLTVHAARLPGPPPRGAVLVVHDTTDLRQLERMRHEFVANVSHELKTPLSVIKACVETLQDGAADQPASRSRFLGRIAHQADRLHNLILDLLVLARIESGEELLEFRAVPVAGAVAAALERHRARAEARHQSLAALPAPPGAGPEVAAWADEEAVDQVLDNLLDNALKYTPEGGRIDVGWQADERQVTLEVRDTGIGIPEADLPRIFERFYRVDKARSREMGGTGLGLSIVKHLAQAMKGTVRATSRVGQGTTFTVTLPRPGARPDTPGTRTPAVSS
jgi:two-component system phosphate regulon sensor histidine kinase PhoR